MGSSFLLFKHIKAVNLDMKYTNLIDLMHHSAKRNTEATAFIFEETSYTYLDLVKFIVVAEKVILEGGIKRGDIIGVT